MRFQAIGIVLLGAVAPMWVSAQVTSIDISTGEFRAFGLPSIGALTVAPRFAAVGAGLLLHANAVFSLGASRGMRSSLQSTLATRKPLLLGVAPTVMIRGQDDALASALRSRRLDGQIGIRIGNERLGANAGVGLAQSVHGSSSRSVQTSTADVHLTRGAFQFRIGYAGNAFVDPSAVPNAASGFALARTRLSDVTTDGSWKIRRFEVGGFVGRRVGGQAEHAATWGGGYASLNVTDRVAILARQESSPSDPSRHLAAQRITSIGFRIRPSLARARFDDGTDAAQFRREFVLSHVIGNTHGIRVYVPGAAQVEIAGTFNQWTPVAMRSVGGGWWELVLPLASGLHTLNVRADGGTWKVPPGLEAVADEFNGTVGVLLIP